MKMTGMKKGQALVEFAVIFPFIILLMIGLIDVGRALLAYSTLNNAVREGTRIAVVGGSEGDISDRISEVATLFLQDFDPASIGFESTGTYTDPKTRITISYTYDGIFPGFIIPITVQSEMLLAPFAK